MNPLTEIQAQIPFELQFLANARRYQQWLRSAVDSFLGDRILELGSGIGNMSQHLPRRERLILTDIDPSLVAILQRATPVAENVTVKQISPADALAQTFGGENLDTVISFNVMEHVEDDAALMRDVLTLLATSSAQGPKRFVSLVPAHKWAYGEMDKKFGHFRRYSDGDFRASLERAGAGKLSSDNYYSRYLNLPALLAWWFNGRLLRKADIGNGNIELFERLCPLIRPVDDFLHSTLRLPLGNSLLAVYTLHR